jgi:hypothetical protein
MDTTLGGIDIDYIYLFVKIAIITAIVLGLSILVPLAIIKRDTFIITQRPLKFAIETFLVGVVPGICILFFTISRGIPFSETRIFALELAIKFSLFHVLFQISGFYKYLIGGV